MKDLLGDALMASLVSLQGGLADVDKNYHPVIPHSWAPCSDCSFGCQGGCANRCPGGCTSPRH